jgi:AbrB family looped-hinge helix DNA binding protein
MERWTSKIRFALRQILSSGVVSSLTAKLVCRRTGVAATGLEPLDISEQPNYDYLSYQDIRNGEEKMSEYLQVRSNGQITLPANTRRKANLKEGDLLEALVEKDGSIRLVPKTPVDRVLAEKYQLDDVAWAVKNKRTKR